MHKKITAVVFILVILGLTTRGINRYLENAAKKPQSIEDVQRENGIPVVVARSAVQSVQMHRTFTGSIKGKEQADAKAKSMERIGAILVQEGARVKQQQVVARLDRSNPQARFQQAHNAFQLAEKTYERIRALFEEGAVSQQDADEAHTRYNIAKNDVAAAADLLDIRAPISGIVTEVFKEAGETVVPGESVVRIADYRAVEVELEVGVSEIHEIKTGQSAEIKRSMSDPHIFHGTVQRLSLSANPVDRNFRVWVEIPNEDNLLRPGMFITADLIVGTADSSVVIPLHALVYEEDRPFAYVVNENRQAQYRQVRLGVQNGEVVQILEGISPNDLVVIEGMQKLRDGAFVHITNGQFAVTQ